MDHLQSCHVLIGSLQRTHDEVSSSDEVAMKWIVLFLNLFVFLLPPLSLVYEKRDVFVAKFIPSW